jgi:hypothetical protein
MSYNEISINQRHGNDTRSRDADQLFTFICVGTVTVTHMHSRLLATFNFSEANEFCLMTLVINAVLTERFSDNRAPNHKIGAITDKIGTHTCVIKKTFKCTVALCRFIILSARGPPSLYLCRFCLRVYFWNIN